MLVISSLPIVAMIVGCNSPQRIIETKSFENKGTSKEIGFSGSTEKTIELQYKDSFKRVRNFVVSSGWKIGASTQDDTNGIIDTADSREYNYYVWPWIENKLYIEVVSSYDGTAKYGNVFTMTFTNGSKCYQPLTLRRESGYIFMNEANGIEGLCPRSNFSMTPSFLLEPVGNKTKITIVPHAKMKIYMEKDGDADLGRNLTKAQQDSRTEDEIDIRLPDYTMEEIFWSKIK